MADRFLLLSTGQSNETPKGLLSDWLASHPLLNVATVSSVSRGARNNRFVMPGNFPGFAEIDLKGLATRSLRYLTFYNPCATGYKTYPCVGRLASGVGATHTSTSLFVEQTFLAGAAVPFTITRQRTGTTHNVTAVSNSGLPSGTGSILTIDGATPWNGPLAGEQFDYPVKVTAGTGTASLTINLGFGLGFGSTLNGALTGLAMVGLTGQNIGQSRVITGFNNGTRVVALQSAFPNSIASTDTFAIAPQGGVAFEDFGLWLPWCRFEAGHTAGKVNPYPPGFNYPNHWSVPQLYKYDATTGQGLVAEMMAYHTGLAAMLREHLNADIYVLTAGVGATALAFNEIGLESGDVGWFDPAAETTWSAAETNNIFRRVIRQVQAGVTAAEADGDTLRLIACPFLQGETDAQLPSMRDAYEDNARGFRSALRRELKALGVWPRQEKLIPIIHPHILTPAQGGSWQYADAVNKAIDVVTEEDVAGGTADVSDLESSGAHYKATAGGQGKLEKRIFDAIVDVRRRTDNTGAVDICNRALKLVGDSGRITSIDPPDGSPQSIICGDNYESVRDALLEMHAWGFATRRKAMIAVDSSTSVWQYAYIAPGDMAQPIAVQPPEAAADTLQPGLVKYPRRTSYPRVTAQVPQEFSLELDERGRRVIYTNQESAVLKYVRKVSDARLFSPLFVEALALLLASEIAGPIVKGDKGVEIANALAKKFEFVLSKAATADANESLEEPDRDASWIEGMG